RTPSALARTIVFAIGSTSAGGLLLAGCSDGQYASPHADLPAAEYEDDSDSASSAPGDAGDSAFTAATNAGSDLSDHTKSPSESNKSGGSGSAVVDDGESPGNGAPNEDALEA